MKALSSVSLLGVLLFSCSSPNSEIKPGNESLEEGGDTSYVYEGLYTGEPIQTVLAEFDGENEYQIEIRGELFSENDTGIVIKTSTITDKMKSPNTEYRKFHNRRIELKIRDSKGVEKTITVKSLELKDPKNFKLNKRIHWFEIEEMRNDSLIIRIKTDDLSNSMGSEYEEYQISVPIKSEFKELVLTKI